VLQRPTTSDGRHLNGLLIAMVLLALVGCSREWPTSEVQGVVTYKGEPVPLGMITFMAADDSGRADTASIMDGNYTLPRAPVGNVTIQISGSGGTVAGASPANAKRKLTKGQIKLAESMGAKIGSNSSETQPKRPPFKLPTKYANASTSGLTYEVRPGDQTYDIDLPP
jgi:hypothetical protein